MISSMDRLTPEAFISTAAPELQALCHQLRELVRLELQQAEEVVFVGWKNISYGTGQSHADKDMICYIAPLKDSVNLGFFRGALLADPQGLLKGTGKLLRHVKLRPAKPIDTQALRELIRQARIERLGPDS